jgi:ABC-type glycerol-3-phosphate transport system permease component
MRHAIIPRPENAGHFLDYGLVAYSLARLRWPGRDLLFCVLLGTMMLSEINIIG